MEVSAHGLFSSQTFAFNYRSELRAPASTAFLTRTYLQRQDQAVSSCLHSQLTKKHLTLRNVSENSPRRAGRQDVIPTNWPQLRTGIRLFMIQRLG